MPTTTRSLLILWHSRTGAARQLAEAAEAGARRRDDLPDAPQASCRVVRVQRREASATDAQHVLAASAYLFVMPENLGSMSGVMKDFFDRVYYDVLDQVAGRPYAVIVAAGTDGQGAARQVVRIATGWRLRSVAEPLIVRNGAQTREAILADKQLTSDAVRPARELGEALAEGLALGIF